MTPSPDKVPLGFRIIGACKLITAALGLAVGFGLFRLFKTDVSASLEQTLRHLHLDPDNILIHAVISGLAHIDRRQLHWIEAGTFFYALLHTIEGIGLLRGKRWGGYLIIVATGSLIPLECYEIYRRLRPLRIAVLLLNVGIVTYLIVRRGELTGAGPRGRAARRSAGTRGGS